MRSILVPTLLAAALLSPVCVSAQTVQRYGAYPLDPSTADRVIVAIPDACGDVIAKPAEISASADDEHLYQLNVFFEAHDDDVVCPGLWPPGGYHAFDIGTLAEGQHSIRVYRVIGDAALPTLEDEPIHEIEITVDNIAGKSVSGAWYAPNQSGRGIFVLRMTIYSNPDVGVTPPPQHLFSVYWANHDADGNPSWALMGGQMSDNVVSGSAINTFGDPLAPGEATLEQQAWGVVSFEYLGCDSGRLTWNANDPDITDGSVDMVKLASPDAQEPCTLPGASGAIWLD